MMEVVYNNESAEGGEQYQEDINGTVAKNFYAVVSVMRDFNNYTYFDITNTINIAFGLKNLCQRINRDIVLISQNSPIYNGYRDAGVPRSFLTDNSTRYFPVVSSDELARMMDCFIAVLKFLAHYVRYGFDDLCLLKILSDNNIDSVAQLNACVSRLYTQDFHFPYEVGTLFECKCLANPYINIRLSRIKKKGFPDRRDFDWLLHMINSSLYFSFSFRFERTGVNVDKVSNYYL